MPTQAEAIGAVKRSGTHSINRFEHTTQAGPIPWQTIFEATTLAAEMWQVSWWRIGGHELKLLKICARMNRTKAIEIRHA
ncbi:MAG: hypothetical protein M3R61_02660 [Chloroflexota bacterium]|nr:hypothetical protein [Chloroflexota bacterium]